MHTLVWYDLFENFDCISFEVIYISLCPIHYFLKALVKTPMRLFESHKIVFFHTFCAWSLFPFAAKTWVTAKVKSSWSEIVSLVNVARCLKSKLIITFLLSPRLSRLLARVVATRLLKTSPSTLGDDILYIVSILFCLSNWFFTCDNIFQSISSQFLFIILA